jgi:hypothetical protein
MERRRFLTRSLELVIAAHCLPLLDAKSSAMQLRPGAKQPLTEASLNAIIPAEPTGLRTLAGQMFPDMKSFIRGRFALSPEQERALTGMSSATVERIHKAVETAIAKGAKVSVAAAAGAKADTDLAVQFDHAGDLRIHASGCINQALRVL